MSITSSSQLPFLEKDPAQAQEYSASTLSLMKPFSAIDNLLPNKTSANPRPTSLAETSPRETFPPVHRVPENRAPRHAPAPLQNLPLMGHTITTPIRAGNQAKDRFWLQADARLQSQNKIMYYDKHFLRSEPMRGQRVSSRWLGGSHRSFPFGTKQPILPPVTPPPFLTSCEWGRGSAMRYWKGKTASGANYAVCAHKPERMRSSSEDPNLSVLHLLQTELLPGRMQADMLAYVKDASHVFKCRTNGEKAPPAKSNEPAAEVFGLCKKAPCHQLFPCRVGFVQPPPMTTLRNQAAISSNWRVLPWLSKETRPSPENVDGDGNENMQPSTWSCSVKSGELLSDHLLSTPRDNGRSDKFVTVPTNETIEDSNPGPDSNDMDNFEDLLKMVQVSYPAKDDAYISEREKNEDISLSYQTGFDESDSDDADSDNNWVKHELSPDVNEGCQIYESRTVGNLAQTAGQQAPLKQYKRPPAKIFYFGTVDTQQIKKEERSTVMNRLTSLPSRLNTKLPKLNTKPNAGQADNSVEHTERQTISLTKLNLNFGNRIDFRVPVASKPYHSPHYRKFLSRMERVLASNMLSQQVFNNSLNKIVSQNGEELDTVNPGCPLPALGEANRSGNRSNNKVKSMSMSLTSDSPKNEFSPPGSTKDLGLDSSSAAHGNEINANTLEAPKCSYFSQDPVNYEQSNCFPVTIPYSEEEHERQQDEAISRASHLEIRSPKFEFESHSFPAKVFDEKIQNRGEPIPLDDTAKVPDMDAIDLHSQTESNLSSSSSEESLFLDRSKDQASDKTSSDSESEFPEDFKNNDTYNSSVQLCNKTADHSCQPQVEPSCTAGANDEKRHANASQLPTSTSDTSTEAASLREHTQTKQVTESRPFPESPNQKTVRFVDSKGVMLNQWPHKLAHPIYSKINQKSRYNTLKKKATLNSVEKNSSQENKMSPAVRKQEAPIQCQKWKKVATGQNLDGSLMIGPCVSPVNHFLVISEKVHEGAPRARNPSQAIVAHPNTDEMVIKGKSINTASAKTGKQPLPLCLSHSDLRENTVVHTGVCQRCQMEERYRTA